jgi:site-specific recombinase XerD
MDGNTMVLLESYGARLARQGLAESTRRKYLAAVDRFLRSLDRGNPESVTRQQVDDYLDRWHAAEQPAPASVRLHLSALKSFYGYLDDRNLLEGRNPVERITAPRVRRRPNDRLRADEAEALLAACLSEQEKVLIWLLRWTGLRVGETLGLTVEDVDLERRVIRVRASKTDAGLRTVPIVDELGVVLLTWIEGLRTRADWRPDMPLLATRGGTPWKEQFAWRLVKRVAHRAELRVTGPGPLQSAVTPHTLRRTYASDLINRGVPLEHVSKMLGHADVRVTQQAYAELEDATAHAAIRRAFAS